MAEKMNSQSNRTLIKQLGFIKVAIKVFSNYLFTKHSIFYLRNFLDFNGTIAHFQQLTYQSLFISR